MKNKKSKKLIVQVLVPMMLVIIVMTSVLLYIVYQSTINGFLEAQDAHMEYLLKNELDLMHYTRPEEIAWYLTQWTEHPEELQKEYPEDFEDNYSEYFTDDSCYTMSWLKTIPEELRAYVSHLQYNNFASYLESTFDINTYDRLVLLSVSGASEGMAIYDYSRDGVGKKAGEYFDFLLDDHPKLKEAVAAGSTDIVCEKTSNFPKEGKYYVGYQPIIYNGKAMAVAAVVYNWDSFSRMTISTCQKAFLLGLAAVFLASVVLVIVLYQKAIRPAAKLKDSVAQYMQDKNSSNVQSRMAEVRSGNEIGALAEMFSDLSVEIDNYVDENVKLVEHKKRIDTELELATNIQSSQLPNKFPAFPDRTDFDIYASMTPAKEVGGDFYDFFLVDDDHLALVIADVSGKGVPAALFMMKAMMLINNFAMSGLSPKEVMEKTNRSLCRNNGQHMFVTAWLGILEISTGKLTASNAGHECPIIRHPGGQFEVLIEKHDFVLGGFERKKYKESEMTLEKGGTLFVYTDGVPEATDAENKMFGIERLTEALNKAPDADPKQLLTNVHEAVNEFVGDAEQFDDLTMLGIRLN